MIKIDLITGFLGSGKTTFIKKYASYLIKQGKNIGILENDFGAVNVDAMLLQDILGENCTLEMVAGGCDADCHKRRFKTKLIAMGMCGYDRVLVEPSGIFDMDEFFDTLNESPVDRWFEIGSIITIIDAKQNKSLSDSSRYILASQVAQAGIILYSHMDEVTDTDLTVTKEYIRQSLEMLHCKNVHTPYIIEKNWDTLTDDDYEKILQAGYHTSDYTKLWSEDTQDYDTLYFMNMDFTEAFIKASCENILNDSSCGKVHRIKGFQKLADGSWISVNITHQKTDIKPITNGQAILIIIGEGLNKEAITKYWGESKA